MFDWLDTRYANTWIQLMFSDLALPVVLTNLYRKHRHCFFLLLVRFLKKHTTKYCPTCRDVSTFGLMHLSQWLFLLLDNLQTWENNRDSVVTITQSLRVFSNLMKRESKVINSNRETRIIQMFYSRYFYSVLRVKTSYCCKLKRDWDVAPFSQLYSTFRSTLFFPHPVLFFWGTR